MGNISRSHLVSLLSRSLGEEKATSVVQEMLAQLHFHEVLLTQEAAITVLSQIGSSPGLVGIAARCAAARLMIAR